MAKTQVTYGNSHLAIPPEAVALVEFMYLVFTRIPGEHYHRQPRSLLLCLCNSFRALILCLLILHRHSGPHSVSDENTQGWTNNCPALASLTSA